MREPYWTWPQCGGGDDRMDIARAWRKLRGKQPKLSDRQQRELCRMHAPVSIPSAISPSSSPSQDQPSIYRTLNR